MGTFNATSGYRLLRLDLTMQGPAANFMRSRLTFSTNNGVFAQNTYDAPPVAFNAWADLQTDSIDWYYSSLGTDVVVTQNSNTSYSFFVRVNPDNHVGFFTVYHSTGGDTFTFVGSNAGPSQPPNGIQPTVSQTLDPAMIGAASTNSPMIIGTASLQNARVSGTLGVTGATSLTTATVSGNLSVVGAGSVNLPPGSLTIDNVANLQTALNNKATTGASASFTTLMATSSFTSASGSFTATSTPQNVINVSGRRGLVFLDGQGSIASSILAYFSCMTPNNCLSVVARNGNVYTYANLGTAAGTGTMMIDVGISTSGNIRVSCALGSTGTVLWNVVYFSSAL